MSAKVIHSNNRRIEFTTLHGLKGISNTTMKKQIAIKRNKCTTKITWHVMIFFFLWYIIQWKKLIQKTFNRHNVANLIHSFEMSDDFFYIKSHVMIFFISRGLLLSC